MARAADLLALIRAVSQQHAPILALDGVVVTGSYDPTDGTVQVILGDTAAIQTDDTSSYVPPLKVQLQTPMIGDQGGPRGGERVTLVPRQSGWMALFEHGTNDSPNAPSGERWICHYNADLEIDAFFKFTNDGATTGDAAGGISGLAGSLFSLGTAGGLMLILNDVLGYAQIGGAGLDPSLDAVATKRYVDAKISDVFNTHTHGGVVGGGASTGPPTQQMDFSGSDKVKAAQ